MTRIFDWDSEKFKNIDVDAHIQSVTAAAAQAAYEDGDGSIPATAEEVNEGAAFVIPLLIPEGLESGDGRKMAENALTTRDLPITLLWQPQTGDGHNGSFIVGRIDTIDRVEGGLGNARGVFDTGPYGREAERLVRSRMLRGVSADLDDFEADIDPVEEDSELADPNKIASERMTVKKARVMAATLVAKPAFQECTIELVSDGDDVFDELPVVDGVYEETPPMTDFAEAQLSALAASAAPVNPPKTWFSNPELKTATPLTVDDDGRVYGHIATWDTDHIGYNYGVRPPRSRSNYAYFRTGLVRTEEGDDVAVGQLTLAGGHAPLDSDARSAVKHYDDTASAVADVTAGEDAFGIWVSGGLRPGVTPEQVRTLRASAPSGDWRPVGGALELVAVCQVNVPGFPVARARVASGAVMALVAAGASQLAKIKNGKLDELSARLEQLERRELEKTAAELAARIAPARDERQARLLAAAENARAVLAPELQKKAEMTARAAELRSKLTEFKLDVKPDFKEELHPRDRKGMFREVLFKLGELLKEAADGPDSDRPDPDVNEAKVALERAADAEDSGDNDAAKTAAEDAKRLIDGAVSRVDVAPARPESKEVPRPGEKPREGGKVSRVLHEVSDDLGKALDGTASSDSNDPFEALLSEDIPQPIEDLIMKLIEQVGENFDPMMIVSRLESRVKEWLVGKGFQSPEDMARAIETILRKSVQPNITQ